MKHRLLITLAMLLSASAVGAQPWVENTSRPWKARHGLEGHHIALWASHGRYYDQSKRQWEWQRPPLYCTSEDLLTQTIVTPLLIPMLERAGAVVFSPRERDWQRHEVIVDNDDHRALTAYREQRVRHEWTKAPMPGFAMHSGSYRYGENPFLDGTARQCTATHSKAKQSTVTYQPNLPEQGDYAVYVSYQTLPKSVNEAHYTVYHNGQKTQFTVNQQMGGGTWVYLGTFHFDGGFSERNRVVVSNYSSDRGIVTTDAVRFGGGMGNIARGGSVSGMPRSLEGARYYAQWAGMAPEIYSPSDGADDYKDDINVRSKMTNYLAGGSRIAPDSVGLRVPIDMALAIHSDAGYNTDPSAVYGTLTICTTKQGDHTLGNGESRQASMQLAQNLFDGIVGDLSAAYGSWTPREVRDRNYSETRLPVMPSTIIETLSHQNFADMRYMLDPNFRFTLARSIYKTTLRYLAKRSHKRAVVMPLQPTDFAIRLSNARRGEVVLSWSETPDPAEPTAAPTSFILYTATGTSDFDNGQEVHGNACTLRLQSGILYHFRIAAANDGGVSEPTAVLSARWVGPDAKTACIIDGFARLSGPAQHGQGFYLDEDFGVDRGLTAHWRGRQQVYDTSHIGRADSTGLGWSGSELAGTFIRGNDFDHVRDHASAIAHAKPWNIVSTSRAAIEHGKANLAGISLTDLVLGLERNDGHSLVRYQAFTPRLMTLLAQHTAGGGGLLVSGAYVASDCTSAAQRDFLSRTLHCSFGGATLDRSGTLRGMGTTIDYHKWANSRHFAATNSDILVPVGAGFAVVTYNNGASAAVASNDRKSRTLTLAVPFECITTEKKRNDIMKGFLNFLQPK